MATEENDNGAFEELLDFIKKERAFDFTGYKRPSLRRRMAKRMNAVGISDFAQYREYLEKNDDEFAKLFDTILINVTAFFRDEGAWQYIAEEIVPRIVDAKAPDHPIRVWSTGCATGEEAYTAAMVLAEALGVEGFRQRVKIYATDVDDDALNVGRHAVYSAKAVAAVPEPLRTTYFEATDSRFAFRKDMRRAVIFGRHDLIQDPPISRIDLLVSRNTLMYFDADTQRRILANFRFALTPEGFLFLGKSEVLVTRTNLFAAIDIKRRVFAKVPSITPADRLDQPPPPPPLLLGEEDPVRLREVGLEVSPVPQILVDAAGRMAAANLQARVLFNLSLPDIGRPLKDLEISYRPLELRSRIDEVAAEHRPVVVRDVQMTAPSGEQRSLDVHVVPLTGVTGRTVGVGISFVETTRLKQLQQAVERSQRDTETAYEELQSTVEELETTNEELQSTNEELETTNEELQSTNEELETMNEELQSTNEELETINDELRERTDEIGRVNFFLETILASMKSGVIVLDPEFRIDAWNAQAEELWGLRADEAVGKHFMNLDIGLPIDELHTPIRAVLNGHSPDGTVTVRAVNRRGRKIEAHVTLTPLAADGGPQGVILSIDAEPAGEA